MTRSSRYTPESPEVAVILNGVWKSGVKTYYRIDAEGKHIDVRIREELIAALGISSNLATRLLQQANLPCAPFVRLRAREKAPSDVVSITAKPDEDMETELEDELEADELDDDLETDSPDSLNIVNPSSNQSKKAIARAERAGKAAEVHAKKFELVRQGSYTGIYNKIRLRRNCFIRKLKHWNISTFCFTATKAFISPFLQGASYRPLTIRINQRRQI